MRIAQTKLNFLALLFVIYCTIVGIPMFLWCVFNMFTFFAKHPLYLDSPASIYVIFINGLLFLTLPTLTTILLWRRRADITNVVKQS